MLGYALEDLQKKLENIIIYRDLSGGSLAAALMSYLLCPHSSTTTPLKPIALTVPLEVILI
jgi:hypothetical protein